MADHARSDHAGVQAQLDRLSLLSPGRDVLGLERIGALMERLGRPDRALPPVLHVAGTNGKGSTCAFLRAAIEAAGLSAHVFTSPHLVRFNERIRLAGRLIEDELLAELLAEVLGVADGIAPSFFEVTTAAAFLAFARTPADACIVEVGLGGRLDATNIIEHPAVCGIAQLGLDHQAFLGDTITQIAAEKAGIAKAGVPLVTLHYPRAVGDVVGQAAAAAGARWLPKGGGWEAAVYRGRLHYRDRVGKLDLPLPRLPGAHQAGNAALATAMLRHQTELAMPPAALRAAMGWAHWPARLQRLEAGRLVERLPADATLWIDGGHNPNAARVLADHFRASLKDGQPFHIILGMLENKDASGFLAPFHGSGAMVHAVPVPGHAHHLPEALAMIARAHGLSARTAPDPQTALATITGGGEADMTILIAGSLYLAGTVLDANETLPD